MSDKLSINVNFIGLNVTHNFIVPYEMTVLKTGELISKIIQEEYPGTFSDRSRIHYLMQETTGKVLDSESSLKQLSISNGEKLVFI